MGPGKIVSPVLWSTAGSWWAQMMEGLWPLNLLCLQKWGRGGVFLPLVMLHYRVVSRVGKPSALGALEKPLSGNGVGY